MTSSLRDDLREIDRLLVLATQRAELEEAVQVFRQLTYIKPWLGHARREAYWCERRADTSIANAARVASTSIQPDGRDMGTVIGTLADLGYGVAWRILDARYFGVPQRRRRVFIVCRAGGDDASALRALCESCDGHPPTRDCTWQGVASEPGGRPAFALRKNPGGVGQGHNTNYVANTLKGQRGRGGGGIGPEETFVVASTLQSHKTGGHRIDAEGAAGGHLVAFHPTQDPITEVEMSPAIGRKTGGMNVQGDTAGVRRLTPIECERLMSWPDSWTAPEGVKAPDSRRYAACGDGVVSNVSEWIGRRIMAAA